MLNIIYLIPLDTVGGGVEVAAKKVKVIQNKSFNFNVEYICKDKSELFSLNALFKSIRSVYAIKPDILILSLWRAQLVGILVKMILPKTKLVFFVHSAQDAHILDYILSRISLLLAWDIWGDSITSLNDRFRRSNRAKQGTVISFSPRIIERQEIKNVKPNFIFWGRVGKEKRVDRAVLIFSKILLFYPTATFQIIGSDGGTLNQVKQLCIQLGINDSVTFHDEMDFDLITKVANNVSFYLQTSLYEGAAMSVMESMKLGLVPIVTPVGEISKYCDNSNSIIVLSDNEAVRDILITLKSQDLYRTLSDNAAIKFQNQSTYEDSIKNACEKLVKKSRITL